MKCAARGLLEIQHPQIVKIRHLGTTAQLCRAISFGEFEASLQISTGFASWQRYCTVL